MYDWEEEFPAFRLQGEVRRLDQVKLRRDDLPLQPTEHALRTAVGFVKSRPFETILFGFLYAVFVNFPSTYNKFIILSKLLAPFKPSGNDYENAGSILGVIGAIEPVNVVVWSITAVIGLGMFAFFLVTQAIVQAGAMLFWLRLVRGQNATLTNSLHVWRYIIPMSLTSLLFWAAIAFGYMAFTIPALILLVGFQFVELVVVDKNLHYVAALSASWEIARGYKLSLFVVVLILGVMNLFGALVCGFGLFVTSAIATGTIVVIYDRIAEPGNAYLRNDEDSLSAFD